MGIIRQDFSCGGTTPLDMDKFTRCNTTDFIGGKAILMSLLDRLSCPVLSLGLSLEINFSNSSSFSGLRVNLQDLAGPRKS